MPRIRCHFLNCVFLDDGYCGAAAVELDPDEGCMTYKQADDLGRDDSWDENNDVMEDSWEDAGYEDVDDDDFWLDDDDDF